METNQAPHEEPTADHLLEDLAALAGMFNPEVIWHEKEQLDDQEEEVTHPAPPFPDTTGT